MDAYRPSVLILMIFCLKLFDFQLKKNIVKKYRAKTIPHFALDNFFKFCSFAHVRRSPGSFRSDVSVGFASPGTTTWWATRRASTRAAARASWGRTRAATTAARSGSPSRVSAAVRPTATASAVAGPTERSRCAGNYRNGTGGSVPTAGQLERALALLAASERAGLLHARHAVLGARDVQATESPGDALYAALRRWPAAPADPARFRDRSCDDIYRELAALDAAPPAARPTLDAPARSIG